MPSYSYYCSECKIHFEIFSSIKDYSSDKKPICTQCKTNKSVLRRYDIDVSSQHASVKKGDTELKTIGDLARRNSDRLSEDEKIHLYQKHNAYKFEDNTKELPTGMNRVKKPEKMKWPGSKGKTKRKTK